MLILTRGLNEDIIIDDHITVTVLQFKGYQVKLGIVAPKSIAVHRQEVYERIQKNSSSSKYLNPTFTSTRLRK